MEGSPLTAMLLFLGPTDMAAIFVIALLLFGPDQLPKVARQVGEVMRHMQNTTQSFMLEMDRAARETDAAPKPVAAAPIVVPHSEVEDEEPTVGDKAKNGGDEPT